MIRGIYPGTFDPVTNGHLDIIIRASKLVDELVVGILFNRQKTPLFSVDERVKMLKEVTADLPNVRVETFDGLLVDFAQELEANVIVRGLRAITDFEYELMMAQMNHKLHPNIETIFLTTNLNYSYLSSTSVKEIAAFHGEFSDFVPEVVEKRLKEKMSQK